MKTEQESNWVAVSEYMPENGKECLVKGFSNSGKAKQGEAFYHPVIGWFGSFNGRVLEWRYKEQQGFTINKS